MYIFIKSTYCSYYVAIQKWVLGFGYPRVSVLGMDFDLKRCSGRVRILSLGFGFGCPDTPPDSNPTRCHP
jgi:hypothetical protein